MKVEFDVKITCGNLYDYLVSYTYTSMQGLVGAAAGALFLVEYFLSFQAVFLVCGVLILGYLPVSLYLKAKQQSLNPIFKRPLHYTLTENGLEVSQEGAAGDGPEVSQEGAAGDGQEVSQEDAAGDGQEVSQEAAAENAGKGQEAQAVSWDAFYKAGSTMGSILLYTSKRSATIFPKRQLQEQGVYEKVLEVISTHMPPKKVNIR